MLVVRYCTTIAILLVTVSANAQWLILGSQTRSDLRSIDAVSKGMAWASGASGVIVHTEDGIIWQRCATPPNAAGLVFASVQGFDGMTGVVMSSGDGANSRVYKTTDGCRTWTKVFDNPAPSGSFQSLHRVTAFDMYLLADPAGGKLTMYLSHNAGDTWSRVVQPGLDLPKTAGGVVAGTASMTNVDWLLTFGTAGADAAVYTFGVTCKPGCLRSWAGKPTPVSRMVASIAGRTYAGAPIPGVTGDVATSLTTTLVAVGGDPAHPDANNAVAAMSIDGGNTWRPAGVQPGGYRSSVAFDPKHRRFISVGPNGTDVSTDDGMSWAPLRPGPRDALDADRHWMSLSLPYAVGANGRIGVLEDASAVATRK